MKPFYAQMLEEGPLTAALVATLPGPAFDGVCTYVDEFDATYRWALGDATAVDGFRVLGHTGGAAGRWILAGDRISLRPLGGGLNDWVRLASAWVAMAYHGTVVLLPGLWTCSSQEKIVSGVSLEMSSAVTINVNLAKLLVPPFTAPFYNVDGTGAPTTTTISVDAAAGAAAITVASAAGLAVDDYVYLRNGLAWRCLRQIKGIVGNVVTIDRALLRPYPIGAEVAVVDGVLDVSIRGNGARITGAASCVSIFIVADRCDIGGLLVEADMFAPFCYDNGSRDSVFRQCIVDGMTTTTQGYILASCENCALDACDSTRVVATNVYIAGSDNCAVEHGMHTDSAGDGLTMDVDDPADTLGNRGCVIRAAAFLKSAGSGIFVKNNSSENTFEGVDASLNVTGYLINSGASRNTIVGGRCRGNSQGAVAVGAGSFGNRAVGLSCSGHDVKVFQVSGGADFEAIDCAVEDTSTVPATSGMFQVGAGSIGRIIGGRWSSSRNAQHGLQVDGGARGYVDGAWEFVGTGVNNAAVIVNQGVAEVNSMKVIAAAGFGVYLNGAAAFARIGEGVDTSQAGTPFNAAVPGSAFNRGQIALTAAAVLAVPFGDTDATDRLFWSYVTNVGATGVVITGAPVAGTGFNIVGLAGDTSLINYEIR